MSDKFISLEVKVRMPNGRIVIDGIYPKAIYYDMKIQGKVVVGKIEYVYPSLEEAQKLISLDFKNAGGRVVEICKHKDMPYTWFTPSAKKSNKKEGCFITTATVNSVLNKEDDCYELNAFRNFRDTYLKENEPSLIEDYYRLAPQIVEKINNKNSNNRIYKKLWENHLKECLVLIEQQKNEEVLKKYINMIELLKNEFLK